MEVRVALIRPIRYLKYLQELWESGDSLNLVFHSSLYLTHLGRLQGREVAHHSRHILTFLRQHGIQGVDSVVLSLGAFASNQGDAGLFGDIVALLDAAPSVPARPGMFVPVIDLGSTGQQAILTLPDRIRETYGSSGVFGTSGSEGFVGSLIEAGEAALSDDPGEAALMWTAQGLCEDVVQWASGAVGGYAGSRAGAYGGSLAGMGVGIIPGMTIGGAVGSAAGMKVGEAVKPAICGFLIGIWESTGPDSTSGDGTDSGDNDTDGDDEGSDGDETGTSDTDDGDRDGDDDGDDEANEDVEMPAPDDWDKILLTDEEKTTFELYYDRIRLVINTGQHPKAPVRRIPVSAALRMLDETLININPGFEIPSDFDSSGPNPHEPRPTPMSRNLR